MLPLKMAAPIGLYAGDSGCPKAAVLQRNLPWVLRSGGDFASACGLELRFFPNFHDASPDEGTP